MELILYLGDIIRIRSGWERDFTKARKCSQISMGTGHVPWDNPLACPTEPPTAPTAVSCTKPQFWAVLGVLGQLLALKWNLLESWRLNISELRGADPQLTLRQEPHLT